jgi:hypothetical protein
MRTFYLLAILLLTATISKAQLKNTKWAGKLNVPDETPVILDFKTDSVNLIIEVNGMVGETMAYSVKDDVITMHKTSGNSPCNVGDVFTVKYTIKDDKLFINNLTDPCEARVQSWTGAPLIRVKQ